MFGKLPPSGRNHGNKQYPIAKTRKHNKAQNHIFIYLNNERAALIAYISVVKISV